MHGWLRSERLPQSQSAYRETIGQPNVWPKVLASQSICLPARSPLKQPIVCRRHVLLKKPQHTLRLAISSTLRRKKRLRLSRQRSRQSRPLSMDLTRRGRWRNWRGSMDRRSKLLKLSNALSASQNPNLPNQVRDQYQKAADHLELSVRLEDALRKKLDEPMHQ